MKQRLVGMAFDFRQVVQVPLVSVFLFIPYAFLSGSPIVFWSNSDQLERLIQLVCIWSICHWLHQGVMGLISAASVGEYDLRTPSVDAEIEQWMGPCKLNRHHRLESRIADSNRYLHIILPILRASKESRRNTDRLHRNW